MIRLGVPTSILGRAIPGCTITWPERHLSHWLVAVAEVVRYLAERQLGFYRLGFRWGMCAELAAFRRELHECRAIMAEVGGLLDAHAVRLALHAGMGAAPGHADPSVVARTAVELTACTELLDAFGCRPEARVCVHVGGSAGAREAALQRCAEQVRGLPEHVRARLALEPDAERFGLVDVLRVAQAAQVPVIFDWLHMLLHNPEGLPCSLGLGLALATWPRGQRAEVHFSSARTEAHRAPERAGLPGRVLAPRRGQHADFVHAHEVAALLAAAAGLSPFDLMIEAKAADLAVLQLRADLEHLYAGLGSVGTLHQALGCGDPAL